MGKHIYAKTSGLGGHGRNYSRPHKVVPLRAIPDADPTLFGNYLVEEWLPALKADVERTTYSASLSGAQRYIIPALGSVPVSDITQRMLKEFYQELLATPAQRGGRPLAKTSVIRVHSTISWALQALVEAGRLPANPAWGARPRLKKSERYEPVIWSPETLCEFLDYSSNDELGALWNVLALTGMRRGEALGLRWSDLAPRYTHVAVKRALVQVDRKMYVSAPKGSQGRNVDVMRATAVALRNHRRKVMRRRSGKAPLKPSDFVFTRRSGESLSPSMISRRFRELVRRGEFPRIRLHDLRHTHASHLLQAGGNIKAVQERLGHANPMFTIDTYIHLMPTIQAEAVKSLAKFYKEVETKKS